MPYEQLRDAQLNDAQWINVAKISGDVSAAEEHQAPRLEMSPFQKL
jgi:hypothetical protein